MGNSNGSLADYWAAIDVDARPAGRVHLGVEGPRPAPAAARRPAALRLRRAVRRRAQRRQLRGRRADGLGPRPPPGRRGAALGAPADRHHAGRTVRAGRSPRAGGRRHAGLTNRQDVRGNRGNRLGDLQSGPIAVRRADGHAAAAHLPRHLRRSGQHDADHAAGVHADRAAARHRIVLIWFGVLYLICMQLGLLLPPHGLLLMTMKGVAPPDRHDGRTSSRAVVPYVALSLVLLVAAAPFPGGGDLAAWAIVDRGKSDDERAVC